MKQTYVWAHLIVVAMDSSSCHLKMLIFLETKNWVEYNVKSSSHTKLSIHNPLLNRQDDMIVFCCYWRWWGKLSDSILTRSSYYLFVTKITNYIR